MSTQKGNIKRTRPQKYKNTTAFKNDMFDTSKRTKELNTMEISEVCQQCKGIIEWKIKFKKYKRLSQPKTCLHCHQKAIKYSYHTLCNPCGKELKVCCKCRQMKEVIPPTVKMKPRDQVVSMLSRDLKTLPERKRRTFHRYLDSLYGTEKKKKLNKQKSYEADSYGSHSSDDDSYEDSEEDDDVKEEETADPSTEENGKGPKNAKPIVTEDYLEKIRAKLDELLSGVRRECDLDGEFEDLDKFTD